MRSKRPQWNEPSKPYPSRFAALGDVNVLSDPSLFTRNVPTGERTVPGESWLESALAPNFTVASSLKIFAFSACTSIRPANMYWSLSLIETLRPLPLNSPAQYVTNSFCSGQTLVNGLPQISTP